MIDLYTSWTPNGRKISIMLEEVQLAYNVHAIDLDAMEQKTPQFLAMNPNGRIPVIVDHDSDGLVVFESGAILIYLAEKSGKLLPTQKHARANVLQWLMFQIGGIGPIMGQCNVFYRYFPEKIQPAIERFQNEGRRLLTVLNTQLTGRDYLCDEYSIADIANWCWARTYKWSGIDITGLNHLQAWIDRLYERPAVLRGKNVPEGIAADGVRQTGQKIIVT